MAYLYHILLLLYHFSLQLAATWHPKAKQWIVGRNGWENKLKSALPTGRPVIWMHCASVGEFEQGRPVLEALREKHPDHFIVLSFFSPSGYEVRKDSPLADYICYLPLDTKTNATKWVAILQPTLTIFVKYEFWYHYLTILKKYGCPTLLVAGVFRKNQWFFQWYGRWALPMLSSFDFFYLQDEASARQLALTGFGNHAVVGDPRVDRVLQIAATAKNYPLIEKFKANQPVFIIGSSWPEDEQRYFPAMKMLLEHGWKIIIAPHEVKPSNILQLEESLDIASHRYSNLAAADPQSRSVLLIDNIGMLSTLYRYGDLAYVGGGFGKSIHNLLEPAAHALPVLFGPKHGKFMEAKGLIQAGGGFSVNNAEEILTICRRFLDKAEREKSGAAALEYLAQQRGATAAILKSDLAQPRKF